MSYEANAFRVKNLHLVLPRGFKIDEFIRHQTGQDCGMRIVVESNLRDWSYNEDGEGLSLLGVVTEKGLEVAKLECTGSGSGHDYDDILKPLFEQFKGNLVATVVWDSGEIVRVKIVEGKVTEEEQDD